MNTEAIAVTLMVTSPINARSCKGLTIALLALAAVEAQDTERYTQALVDLVEAIADVDDDEGA